MIRDGAGAQSSGGGKPRASGDDPLPLTFTDMGLK